MRLPAVTPVSSLLCPPFGFVACLQRVVVGLAGADAHGARDVGDEDLAVADLSGFRRRGDGVDDAVGLVVRDRYFDPHLGQEMHGIFGAAINFGVALLPAIAL